VALSLVGCARTHRVGVPVAATELSQMQAQLNGKDAAIAYFEGELFGPVEKR
jgi:hypothetical protein